MSDGRRPRRQLVAKISRSYKGICRRRRRRRVKGGIRSRRQNFTINHDEKALIHSHSTQTTATTTTTSGADPRKTTNDQLIRKGEIPEGDQIEPRSKSNAFCCCCCFRFPGKTTKHSRSVVRCSPKKELLFLPFPRPPTGNVRIPNDQRRGTRRGKASKGNSNGADWVRLLAHHF